MIAISGNDSAGWIGCSILFIGLTIWAVIDARRSK